MKLGTDTVKGAISLIFLKILQIFYFRGRMARQFNMVSCFVTNLALYPLITTFRDWLRCGLR
jgi:hypothetical protein